MFTGMCIDLYVYLTVSNEHLLSQTYFFLKSVLGKLSLSLAGKQLSFWQLTQQWDDLKICQYLGLKDP